MHDRSSGKLGVHAKEGRWVSYDIHSKGHRVYWKDKKTITVERGVVFSKSQLPMMVDDEEVEVVTTTGESVTNEGESAGEEARMPTNAPSGEDEQSVAQSPAIPVNPTLPPVEVRRSSRLKKASQYVKDIESGEFLATREKGKLPKGMQKPSEEIEMTGVEEEIDAIAMAAQMGEVGGYEPASLAEAMCSPGWPYWKEAMAEEIKALQDHKTWRIDKPPKDANIVGCRWVYHLKRDAAGNIARYKARLVAQGFSQVPGVDFNETYAPVAKMASIRTILALAADLDYEIHQVDVKNAYLNGKFEDEVVYMKLPPGVKLTEDKSLVCLLLKPLYGLKQAGRYWYQRMRRELEGRLRLIRCEVDHAVFTLEGRASGKGEKSGCEDEKAMIVAHVDDLTLVTSSLVLMQRVKGEISRAFQIRDMGEINWILGFSVKRNREKRTISLSQESYIRAIVKRYGFEDLKPSAVPMSPGCKLSTADSPKTPQEFSEMKDKPYREAIGAAQYASVGTRPDITYVVSQLSKYLEKPGLAHWNAVKCLYHYLAGTADYAITYGETESNLVGYCDADGSAGEDRKAVSGYAFMVNGGAVSWSSKKQEIISLSTTEAEYVAMTHASKELIWLRTLIGQTFGDIVDPTTLHSDNQSAIALTKDHQYHARTKHIDIRFHFIRWIIGEGKIKLVYCPTGDMLADTLTKPLPSAKVKHFATSLGLRCV